MNFKGYPAASLDLQEVGLTLLVSENNAGKSALLGALDILAGEESVGRVRHAGAFEPAEIQAIFRLKDDDRQRLFGQSQITDEWQRSEAFTRLRLVYEEVQNSILFTHLDAWRIDGFETILKVKWDDQTNGETSGVPLGDWFASQGPTIPFSQSRFGSGHRGLHPHIDTRLAPLDRMLANWMESIYHFHALRQGTERERPSDSQGSLEPSGQNLAEALLYLNTNRLAEWDGIRDVVSDVLPDVGDLETPTRGTQVWVALRDPHLNITQNIKDLGTGVEQVVMTAYVGLRQPDASLVIIEEPETNLHPAAQRQLLGHLRRWAGTRQFIVSTHSSVFLDQSEGQSAVWLVERQKGKSRLRPADTELPAILRSIGVRLSDVLSAERVLVVEGPSDRGVLLTLYPDLSRPAAGVAVVVGSGGDLAWHLDRIDQVVAAADELERSIRFLRDRDEMTDDQVKKLETGGRVGVLEVREIENYFLKPATVAAALTQRLEEVGRQAVVTEDVESVLLEGAESLRTLVVLKRLANALLPIRLLDRVTVRSIIKSGISLESVLNRVKENLPPSGILQTVETLWHETEADVTESWFENWQTIVPGSDVLKYVWSKHELEYDKSSDSPRLAAALGHPPDGLTHLLQELGTLPDSLSSASYA